MGASDQVPVLELGHVTADLVVLTVLPEEYAAVLACLHDPELLRGTAATPNACVWRLGMIDASHYSAPFKVAVGIGTPTTTFGALAAIQAIQLFDPRYVAFVGVAGGFDREGQRHGDVAVSSVVTAYEYGKVDTGGVAPRGNFTYRCNEALVRAADAVTATGVQWWRDDENVNDPPRVRTGMIASGDKVIDDPDEAFFVAVRAAWPKLLAVEMEGAGVAAAVHEVQGQRAVGFILVRGISDMPHAKAPGAPVSTQERDGWKVTASHNAARFLAHLVATAWPIPPRGEAVISPRPDYQDPGFQALSEQLERARQRKQSLHDAGVATDEVDREILQLRRQLREGGRLRAGDALGDGRYLVIRPVGRGGFAVVWEAFDRTEQRQVAIKVLHSHLASDPQRRERFFRGARVMMELEHPAVVRVYDPRGEEGAFCYFVMEFVPGGNLRDAVIGQRVDDARRLPLILQVAEALAEAHRRDLVHRDIKPANILLDEEGNAKLTDFDLVGAQDTTGGTRTGALGTVVYAAPECLDRPQDATARVDIFGLGMTAIFCLCGRDLPIETFRSPDATIGGLECSRAVRLVIKRAVMWTPDDRFADATAMLDALRAALNPAISARTDDREMLTATRAVRRWTLWRYALVLLPAIAAVFAAKPCIAPGPGPTLTLDVAIQLRDIPSRSPAPRVGDIARIQVSGGNRPVLRIYHNDDFLVACPGNSMCWLSDEGIAIALALDAVGTYTVVASSPGATLLSVPQNYVHDVAAGTAAGVETRQQTIDVRF